MAKEEKGRRQEKTETNLENLFPRLVVFCLLLSSAAFFSSLFMLTSSAPLMANTNKKKGKDRRPRNRKKGKQKIKLKKKRNKIISVYFISFFNYLLIPFFCGLSSSSKPSHPIFIAVDRCARRKADGMVWRGHKTQKEK